MRKIYLRFAVKMVLMLGLATPVLAQQPFVCDGKFYFVSAVGSNSSQLLSISKDSSLSAKPLIQTISADLGHKVTAIGFNVQDNFIYGLERFTGNLMRIGADGIVQNLGVPPNLRTDLEYFAGETRPYGGGLYVVGRTPGGNDDLLFTINLQPPYYAGQTSIVTDEPTRITDMAFDPVFGTLTGFDENKKRLVKISIGGLVTSIHYEQQPQLSGLGSLFFDRWGNLYGINGSADESLVLFDKFNGKVVRNFKGPGGGFADGCSCPYRIDLWKSIEPDPVVPCSEVTLTYTFLNTAGTAYTQMKFLDELPADFTITEIVKKPHATVVSGVGSNVFELSGMEVLLDQDVIILRVRVGQTPGVYASQAIASGFPLGLGIQISSDDPTTPAPDDPTTVTIVGDGNLMAERAPKICPDGSFTLTAAGGGIEYLWSNGATGESTAVSEPGLYWVEVLGACGLYRDTVQVTTASLPSIDLGDDRTVPFGRPLVLTYTTLATGNMSFFWNADGATLDCPTCPNPQAEILTPATFFVTLTDSNGCTASDELVVGIRQTREIFFPTAFSPNGDGINDLFYPQAAGDFLVKRFRVYDRWGNRLFDKKNGTVNDSTAGWDGTARGKKADFGVYRWETEIEFPGGVSEVFRGEVMLVR